MLEDLERGDRRRRREVDGVAGVGVLRGEGAAQADVDDAVVVLREDGDGGRGGRVDAVLALRVAVAERPAVDARMLRAPAVGPVAPVDDVRAEAPALGVEARVDVRRHRRRAPARVPGRRVLHVRQRPELVGRDVHRARVPRAGVADDDGAGGQAAPDEDRREAELVPARVGVAGAAPRLRREAGDCRRDLGRGPVEVVQVADGEVHDDGRRRRRVPVLHPHAVVDNVAVAQVRVQLLVVDGAGRGQLAAHARADVVPAHDLREDGRDPRHVHAVRTGLHVAQLPRERRHPERPALRAAVARGHGVGDHRRGPLDAAAERLQSRRVERVEQDDAAVPPKQARRALDVVAAVLARAQHLEPGRSVVRPCEALPQLPDLVVVILGLAGPRRTRPPQAPGLACLAFAVQLREVRRGLVGVVRRQINRLVHRFPLAGHSGQ